MGFLKRLVGQPQAPAAPAAVVPGNSGYFQSATSPSGAFRLDWADAETDRHRFVPGWWRLVYGQQVCAQGTLRRPQEGKVADNGVFILTDWPNWGGPELAAILYAFDGSGRCWLQQKTAGCLPLSSAVAQDGSIAVWSFGVGSRVECYEIASSRQRWCVSLPVDPLNLVIDVARGYLWVADRENRGLWVRLTDGAVDEAQVRALVLEDPFRALDVVRGELEATTTPSPEQVTEWNAVLDRAIAKRLHEYPRLIGQTLRLEGEIAEKIGDKASALRFHLDAMSADPKVGVKRRVDALQAEGITATPRLEIAWMAREAQAQRGEPVPPAPSEPRPNVPYANTACPHCGVALNPLPKAKKKCPGCGQSIYVRSGPDGQRHLLREVDLPGFEQWWVRDAQQREQREAAARAEEDRRLGLLSGDSDVEVVGESHYQAALERAAGGRRPESAQVPVIAELVREPKNKYDRNAIRVVVNGETVGYLCRDDAEDYQGLLKRLERERRPARCRATIVGGWDDGRSRGSFGIELDGLPYAE